MIETKTVQRPVSFMVSSKNVALTDEMRSVYRQGEELIPVSIFDDRNMRRSYANCAFRSLHTTSYFRFENKSGTVQACLAMIIC